MGLTILDSSQINLRQTLCCKLHQICNLQFSYEIGCNETVRF